MDFLRSFSKNLYEDYCIAENFCCTVPEYTLVKLRAYAMQCTDEIYKLFNISNNSKSLYDKINSNTLQDLIPQEIREHLNYLRLEGNKGAHPEKFQRTPDETLESAKECLKKAYEMSVWLYKQINKDCTDEIPAFTLREEVNLDSLCKQAVFDNNTDAQYAIGRMLETKADEYLNSKECIIFPKWKYDDAIYWYTKAHIHSPVAMYRVGMLFLNKCGTRNEEEDQALLLIKSSAYDDWFPDAQYTLGTFYLEGKYGCKKDLEEAISWFSAAAEQDNLEALNALAMLYRDGLGVEKCLRKTFEYLHKAAQSGYPSAQYNLGDLYEKGLGVEKSLTKAFEWYEKAALEKNLRAQISLFHFYSKGIVVNQDSCKAVEYLQRVVKNSFPEERSPEAFYYLGNAYKEGDGIEKDYLKAFQYFIACVRCDKKDNRFYKRAKKEIFVMERLLKEEFINSNTTEKRRGDIATIIDISIDENRNVYKTKEEGMESSYRKLKKIMERNQDEIGKPRLLSKHKIGRNDPCICGSGKKYKKCCGMR